MTRVAQAVASFRFVYFVTVVCFVVNVSAFSGFFFVGA
jgi:hypothetical protein